MVRRYTYILTRRKQKMNNDQLINLFTILLFIMIGVLAVLCTIFIVLKLKSNQKQNKNISKNMLNMI